MTRLSDVKAKIRESAQWGFLAEMIGETNLDSDMIAGVDHRGVLLLNTKQAMVLTTNVLVAKVRHAFAEAQERRTVVQG